MVMCITISTRTCVHF